MSLRDQQWKPVIYLMALSMILSVNGSPILISRPTSVVGTVPCPFPSLACNSGESTSCLQVSDICDGIQQCSTGQDESNCEMRGYILSTTLMSSRDFQEEDTVIENISLESCAKFCTEEDRFSCAGFQHNFQTNHCRLLDSKFTKTKTKPSLRSFWLSFARVNQANDQDLSYEQDKSDFQSDKKDEKVSIQSTIPLHDFEGGFDSIVVEADLFSSLPQSERPKRQLTGALGRPLGSCGKPSIEFDPSQLRVVGGVPAPNGAYPWQVALKDNEGKVFCGGVIIESRFILTAAHCLFRYWPDGRDELVVIVGEHDLKADGSKAQILKVEKFVTHPNYHNSKTGDDIALIKLQTVNGQGIIYNDNAQPICLPNSEQVYQPETICSVSGWGMKIAKDTGSVPQILHVANVPILSDETCIRKDVYGNFLNSSHFPDSMVCAGYLEGHTDACSGDSGGPLACKINGQFQLLGLVSWGDDQPGGCASANKPGVYTKILPFIHWIQEWTDKL